MWCIREGVAPDSDARRRSHLVWAPPHKIFLLKNLAPAFDSHPRINIKKGPLTWPSFDISAQGGSRTLMTLRSKDFESFVSAIPPPGRFWVRDVPRTQLIIVIYNGKIKVIWHG